ncbi:MAG: hypothetical protein FWG31_01955 [Oscillospiraceae bacterium]|nr:hypothetical protein [Oscillospiraceae bacterium]
MKRVKAYSICLTLALFCQSCTNWEANKFPAPTEIPEKMGKDMRIYAEKPEYPVGSEKINYIIENLTDSEIGYSPEFFVQKWDVDIWVFLEFTQTGGYFGAVLLYTPPNQSTLLTFDFNRLKKPLDAGKYRFVKVEEEYIGVEEDGRSVKEKVAYFFEFTLY